MIHNYLYKADEYRTRMKVLKTKTKEEQTTLVARGVKKDRNMAPRDRGICFRRQASEDIRSKGWEGNVSKDPRTCLRKAFRGQ